MVSKPEKDDRKAPEASGDFADDRDWLRIGQVGRPHGIRGALHVRPYNPDSDALGSLSRVRLMRGKEVRELEIESSNPQPKDFILTFRGVSSREAAQLWTGAEVFAPRSSLPPLEPGEYYLADLVGCSVFVLDRRVGTVAKVRSDPSCDTAVISKLDGGECELPLVDDWVGEVDVEARKVVLESEEGLIEP